MDPHAAWDSQVSAYNVVRATPFRRDLLGELVTAARAHGLKCGFYYSHWLDWDHPGGGLPPWPEISGDYPFTQPTQAAYESYWTVEARAAVASTSDGQRLAWRELPAQRGPDRRGRM